jgi:hypothetical protein
MRRIDNGTNHAAEKCGAGGLRGILCPTGDGELLPTELDFELLSEMFEMKGGNLAEVLWYLNVFLRAAGHPDGIQGKMAVRLLKSLGRIGKVRAPWWHGECVTTGAVLGSGWLRG